MATKSEINNRRGLKNVLIARFTAITDVVLTIPVVYSACRCYPNINFYLITRPSMTSMFIDAPKNLKVIGVNIKNDYRGIGGARRLVKELSCEYAIDAFVDLQNDSYSRWIRLFCHFKKILTASINNPIKESKPLIRKNNKVMLPLSSMRARYREAFFRIGLPIQERFKGYFEKGAADASAFADITQPKSGDEIWIGIAPFAKHKGKMYPLASMEKVVDDLSQISRVKIFLFGGGDEEQQVLNNWVKKYERVQSLADRRYGFPTELALMNHLDVMVTMDSANMHLATLVKTRVITIWGATHPYCGFKGWHQKEENMIQLPMTCRPCSMFGDKPCLRGDYHCLAAISPQIIIETVRAFIINN